MMLGTTNIKRSKQFRAKPMKPPLVLEQIFKFLSLLRLLQNNIIAIKSLMHKPWYKLMYSRFYVAVGKDVMIIFTSKLIIKKIHVCFSF